MGELALVGPSLANTASARKAPRPVGLVCLSISWAARKSFTCPPLPYPLHLLLFTPNTPLSLIPPLGAALHSNNLYLFVQV